MSTLISCQLMARIMIRYIETTMTEEYPPHKWLLRWMKDAPARWFGKNSSARHIIEGSSHGLAYLRNLARGNDVEDNDNNGKQDVPAVAIPRMKANIPVLLIHGFLGTRGSMYILEKRLQDDGARTIAISLGTLNTRDIRQSAFLLHRKIEAIADKVPGGKIDIIGHSMGGLIGLYYLKKLGGDQHIRKLILLGSPVLGTWAALLGVATVGLWAKSSWQLLPRSRLLDELMQGPLPKNVSVYSIAAAKDRISPVRTTYLQGAEHIVVPYGHASLVISQAVYERIRIILDIKAGNGNSLLMQESIR